MTLYPDERSSIINYRLERALSTIKEAQDNYELGHWNLVGNRLYYAFYYAGSALLLSRSLPTSSHAGFIRLFNLHFIKSGEVDSKFSKILANLFRCRQSGDYDDIYDLTKEDILPFIEPVKEFVNIAVEKLK